MKMMDKRAKEIENKKAHKKGLNKKKKTTELQDIVSKEGEDLPIRQESTKKTERKNILIVCVGENTEPQYFEKFKLSNATIVPRTASFDPLKQAKWTCDEKNIREIEIAEGKARGVSNFKFTQIWCVFDKDSFDKGEFNTAIKMCEDKGVVCVYSNQAFELWFILHFELLHAGFQRTGYKSKLNQHLKKYDIEYTDQKEISQEFFDVLYPNLQTAINYAKKGCEHHTSSNPADSESSTTVFKLVEELLKYS